METTTTGANYSCATSTRVSIFVWIMLPTHSPTSNSSGAGPCTCKPSSTTSQRCSPLTEANTRLIPWEKPMTLENIVLQKLDDWRPETSDRQTLEVIDTETKWAASLSIQKNDALSAALWEMSVRAPAPLAEAGLSLKAWADKVA